MLAYKALHPARIARPCTREPSEREGARERGREEGRVERVERVESVERERVDSDGERRAGINKVQ